MIQVAAYGQSSDSPVFLDVQKAPGISANYSFADVRDPSKRNSSYSHTFKLPFTQTNNQFFENLFEVNLDASTFNPQLKTKAQILVNGITQLTGVLQIKNILTKAKLYEVVVFGEGGDLFLMAKEGKLKDAFTDTDDETLLTTWNHKITYTNIVASWTGSLTNTAGDTISDILYPIVDYARTNLPFGGSGESLTLPYLPQFLINNSPLYKDVMLRPWQQRPAIKIKTIFQQILKKAGFSYTSTFIDSTYFGKLFALLATENEEFPVDPIGGCKIGMTNNMVLSGTAPEPIITFNKETPSPSIFYDIDGAWSTTQHHFTCTVPGNYKFAYKLRLKTIASGATTDIPGVYVWLYHNGMEIEQHTKWGAGASASTNNESDVTDEWSGLDLEVGDTVYMKVKLNSENDLGATVTTHIMPYVSTTNIGSYFELLGSNTKPENVTVYIPDCLPDIDQDKFLKDIIQRFNLCVIPSPEQEKHLIIEPFIDYIEAGSQKDWEDKLDTSKEVSVKFTNELMNQSIEFADAEDDDSINAYHQKAFGHVYGYFEKTTEGKDFAKEGALTNEPVFSPFIPRQLDSDWELASEYDKFLIHRNYEIDDGQYKPTTTKPKMFFYSGSTTNIGAVISWYDGVNQTVQQNFSYPYCSSFDEAPTTSATKDLRWGGGWAYERESPLVGTGWGFNDLFETYWAKYINEIYSDDARLMTCYVNLTPTDIIDFNFNDHIFINNCFWRINKITNYEVGETTSTQVEFIKILETANNRDCLIEPSAINADGTVDFVNTSDGSAASVTQVCCEEFGYYWNPSIPDCYWKNFKAPPPDINPQMLIVATPLATGSLKAGTGTYKSETQDALVLSTRNLSNNTNSGYMVLTYTGQTDDATLTEIFVRGGTERYKIPLNTLCTLRATCASVQSGQDANNGSIGSSSYTMWMGAVKNVDGTASVIGQREAETEIQDSDASRRNLEFGVTSDTVFTYLTIKVQGNASMRILWAVDVKIEYNQFAIYNTTAIWMDDNNMQFQDGDQMLWN